MSPSDPEMRRVVTQVTGGKLFAVSHQACGAIIASLISKRKGYGEKPGLGTGLLLSALAIVIWLLWPAKPDSQWRERRRRRRAGKS